MTHSEIITKIVVPVISGLCSGLVVFFLIPDWQTTARQNEWIPKSDWKSEVKEKGWILKDSCPAYPLKVSITGPGENSTLSVNDSSQLTSNIIAELSRSLAKDQSHIGVIFKYDNDKHYRTLFPNEGYKSYGTYFRLNDQRNIIRFNELYLPKVNSPSSVKIWVFIADEKDGIGSMYMSLDEIINLPYVLSYSNGITYKLSKKG